MNDDSARWISVLDTEGLPPFDELVEVCVATPKGDPLFVYARRTLEEGENDWSWSVAPPCGVSPSGATSRQKVEASGCMVTHHRRLPRVPDGFEDVRDHLKAERYVERLRREEKRAR